MVTATVEVVAMRVGRDALGGRGRTRTKRRNPRRTSRRATPATTTVPISAHATRWLGRSLDVGGRRAASGSGGGGGRSSHPTVGPPARPIGGGTLFGRSRAVHMSPRDAANVRSSKRLDRLQLAAQTGHLAHDRGDHPRRAERRFTAGAREVVDPELDDLEARASCPDDQLGVDERALAAQLDVRRRPAAGRA